MSRLAILAPLLLLFGITVAQITIIAPDCTTLSWQWTYNSLGQNPCTVVAYLMATCSGDLYSYAPLQPGEWYSGPNIDQHLNQCSCSTITYSLISACEVCQQGITRTWSEYASNCTMFLTSSFPNPVPSETSVPHWTVLDVTRENNWDNITSFADQSPDYGPGTSINISTSATPTPTTSVTTTLITSPTLTPTPPSPTHTHSSPSNSGAIAGGVVGGVGAVAVACLAIFWLRRKRPQAPSAAFVLDDSPMSAVLSSDDDIYVTPFMPGTPPTPLRLYDPNDPTTFPGFHGAGQAHISGPQGYHGLPTV